MQTLFSNKGSPSFFFTKRRLICSWNCVKALSSFIVQYSRQDGSLVSTLFWSRTEQVYILSQPPPMRIMSPSTAFPLWNDRISTEGPQPVAVDRSKLISATRLDLLELVFPPKMRTEHSLPGFFTINAPSKPQCREQGSFLQLESPEEYDQMALVLLLLPEYPPNTQICSPYSTTEAAALGNCIEGICFHFLDAKSQASQAESSPFSSEPYCLPPMTQSTLLSWMAQCAYLAFIMSGSTSNEFSGSCSSLVMLTLMNFLLMLPSRICESMVALELMLASRSSTPPVMKPRVLVCRSAWQQRGMAMREGMGMKAEGVNPSINPFVAVLPIIVSRKSSGQ